VTAPASTPPETAAPETIAANLRRALLKGFAIPAAVLVFFAVAPAWLNQQLHDNIASAIQRSDRLSEAQTTKDIAAYERVDFREARRSDQPELQRMRQSMERNGITGHFQRLYWGRNLSVLLMLVLVGATAAMLLLNRRAQRSRAALISSYRIAWKLSILAALAQVFLLIPLLAYGIYELTTMAVERYFPQLIGAIVIGGLVALWRSAGILLKPLPLEFEEPLSREVTPEEAPELWQAVRDAAARLHTAPPDRILVGMQLNFYVTELAVRHGSGRVEGRTLFLSHPLLTQLSSEEVLAIIGHELGHFIGEDTRLTREFYPLRLKAHATMLTLARSGWVGWTSVHALSLFTWCFGATEQAMSRARELLADRVAADLTSPDVAGRALVKFHVISEAYQLGMAGEGFTDNPFTTPLGGIIRDQLVPNAAFWKRLFETKTPHPLDSHPPLRARLDALGVRTSPEGAMAVAVAETVSAYARWFEGRDALFADVTREAAAAVARVRARLTVVKADYDSEAGRKLLDEQFPERRWRVRPSSVWLMSGVWAVIAAGLLAGAVALADWVFTPALGAVAALAVGTAVVIVKRFRGGEFVLHADRLTYSGWQRPLRFSDLAGSSARKSNGSLIVTFRLKQPAPPYWRGSLPFARRSVSVNLMWVDAKQDEVLRTLHRYLTRELAE
jgi:Zn-dependent protease with chaperone function